MEKLKLQFATVSKLLFSEESRTTYGQAIALTWSIIREVLTLAWLLFCSVFLIFFWGGNYARQAGQNVRNWYSEMDEDQKKNVVGAVAGTLKESFGSSESSEKKTSSLSLVDLAKSQLDIKNDPPALKALPSAPKVEKQAEEIEQSSTSPTATLEKSVEESTSVEKASPLDDE